MVPVPRELQQTKEPVQKKTKSAATTGNCIAANAKTNLKGFNN